MKYSRLLILIFIFTHSLWCQTLDPVPSKLTHLFYTPTPHVNSQNSLVVGFHEISYSLDGNLQLQLSLFESIGHVDFGAKYQLGSDLAIGGGLADWIGPGNYRFGRFGRKRPYYPYSKRRFGLFLTGGLSGSNDFSTSYTLHTQIGSVTSLGLDLGASKPFSDVWSLILEVGSSINVNSVVVFLSGTGGVRIVPPPVPYLFIDLGITPLTIALGEYNGFGGAGIYIDLSVAFDLNG